MKTPQRDRPTGNAGRVAVGSPWLTTVVGVVAAVGLLVPFLALVVDISPSQVPGLLATEAARDALWLSLRTSLVATVVVLVLGTPLAVFLTRSRFWGRSVVRSLVILPLVLPPVVAGIALTTAFGRRGLIGAQLEAWGLSISFTTLAVVMAQVFVSLPFLVVALESTLASNGDRYEKVAQSLGMSPVKSFFAVTLPLLGPGLVSGSVLTFARALGEFGATITFAGSLQGTTRTVPLEIYLQRETDPDAAVALSLVLMVVAIVVIGFAYSTRVNAQTAGARG